jgi:pyridoxine 5-phosphate synthase
LIRLSVNVNKVATVRNSRGGASPSVLEAARVCLDAGAGGITVHAREDQRHIRPSDVRELAELLAPARRSAKVEYNLEGDPRPDWLALVHEVRPDQATLVPVRPGEITSEAGWSAGDAAVVAPVVAELRAAGIRVSVFIDARLPAVEWAVRVGAERVELYTGPFAAAYAQDPAQGARVFAEHAQAAARAHELGLGINAGHDLDLDNLTLYRQLPHLAEVSIGHAIIARALFEGLGKVVGEYLAVLAETTA